MFHNHAFVAYNVTQRLFLPVAAISLAIVVGVLSRKTAASPPLLYSGAAASSNDALVNDRKPVNNISLNVLYFVKTQKSTFSVGRKRKKFFFFWDSNVDGLAKKR